MNKRKVRGIVDDYFEKYENIVDSLGLDIDVNRLKDKFLGSLL